MGHNKLFLPWHGEPLVRRAARMVTEAGCAPVVVVTADAWAERVEACMADLPGIRVHAIPGGGPTSDSLHAGLAQLPDTVDAALVMLADMVHVDTPMLTRLRASLQAQPESLVGVRYGATVAPPMGFARCWFAELLVCRGDGCGKALLQRHGDRVRWFDFPADAAADVDTPADWQQLTAGSDSSADGVN